jgi:hypothetical protein
MIYVTLKFDTTPICVDGGGGVQIPAKYQRKLRKFIQIQNGKEELEDMIRLGSLFVYIREQ